ncbi:MAG: ABC transporter ATP-binding protein [bacterium]
MEMPLLEIKNLTTYYKKSSLPVVDNVTFDIRQGEVVALFGESGSGKTQIAYSIMGLIHHLQGIINGEIWFKGENLLDGLNRYRDFGKWIKKSGYEEKMRQIRGREISLIMQGARSALNPFQKIRTQVEEVYLINDERHQRHKKTDEIFKKLHLYGKAEEYPHHLSGGMCQRAIISMAIAANPTILIADEPTTGIDPPLMIKIIELLKEFLNENGNKRALFFISHDLKAVEKLADRVIVIYAGEIVEKGKKEILTDKIDKHPYTKMLIEAHKSSKKEYFTKQPILDQVTKGCKFYNKCSVKNGLCLTGKPELYSIDTELEHEVRCFNYS